MSSFLFYKSWFLFSENSCLTLTTWKSPFILIFIFHRIFTFPFNFFLFLSYVLCFGGILQDSCCIQCSLLQLSLNQLLCSIRPNINKETASWNTLTFSACKVEVCFPCKVLAYFLFFFLLWNINTYCSSCCTEFLLILNLYLVLPSHIGFSCE